MYAMLLILGTALLVYLMWAVFKPEEF
ncbi:potassium-transporting ATPase subunit F [Vibrio cholerae]|nr:potassium-transporting ATPase subunit F [Vibrio fluvialis]ELB7341603.1 potassium-transporting ATPase subunit F [Vibrio cholerae]ELF5344643.1 potassium-transporting ATPase subunit F [Vibrio metschnikovii]MCA0785222.1 potassium-transporting ATPase subunit F [Vibrio vulnificus]ELC9567199.1 potassium-transporting ATPase subunit F [Vibrio cholerae]